MGGRCRGWHIHWHGRSLNCTSYTVCTQHSSAAALLHAPSLKGRPCPTSSIGGRCSSIALVLSLSLSYTLSVSRILYQMPLGSRSHVTAGRTNHNGCATCGHACSRTAPDGMMMLKGHHQRHDVRQKHKCSRSDSTCPTRTSTPCPSRLSWRPSQSSCRTSLSLWQKQSVLGKGYAICPSALAHRRLSTAK